MFGGVNGSKLLQLAGLGFILYGFISDDATLSMVGVGAVALPYVEFFAELASGQGLGPL